MNVSNLSCECVSVCEIEGGRISSQLQRVVSGFQLGFRVRSGLRLGLGLAQEPGGAFFAVKDPVFVVCAIAGLFCCWKLLCKSLLNFSLATSCISKGLTCQINNLLLVVLCYNENKRPACFHEACAFFHWTSFCVRFLGVISATCWWPAPTLQRNVLRLSMHSSVCTCLHLNAGCRAQRKWHISPSPSRLLPAPVSTRPCLSALISISLTVKVNINPFPPPLSCAEAEL